MEPNLWNSPIIYAKEDTYYYSFIQNNNTLPYACEKAPLNTENTINKITM